VIHLQERQPPVRCKIFYTVMPLSRGRLVAVLPCSTFSDCCHLATTLNAEVQKTAKIRFFSPTEGDRINISRQNLASKRAPWVCYSTPNLALMGKVSRYRRPKCQNLPKIVIFWPPEADTMNTFR